MRGGLSSGNVWSGGGAESKARAAALAFGSATCASGYLVMVIETVALPEGALSGTSGVSLDRPSSAV